MSRSQSKPQSLFVNVLSGGITRIARAMLQVFITPILIFLLGAEQYGLVAFSMTLQMLFFMLDQAMSPVVIREFGMIGDDPKHARRMWNIFHTFERCSLIIAVFVGALLVLLAPYIAQNWLNAEDLNSKHVTWAIRLMGIFLACQWPSLLYSSCFIGLHRQSILAKITVIISYLQAASGVSLLYFWKADITVFLSVQILFALVATTIMRIKVKQILPKTNMPPIFEISWLKSIWRFAGGTFVIGITTALLTQTDKVFMSKFAPLSEFSAYALSFNLAAQVAMIISAPLMISIQPVIADLLNKNDQPTLKAKYHTFSQLNAVLNYTFFGALGFYAAPLITLWLGTESPVLEMTIKLVPWIVIGTIFNALNSMPYIVQIAAGWTRLKLTMNVVQVCLYVILLFLLYPRYGIMVGPCLWIALNLANTLIEAPIMHKYYLRGTYFSWLLRDTLMPGALAVLIFAGGQYLLPTFESILLEILKACFVSTCVLFILILALPAARHAILAKALLILHTMRAQKGI